jgi:hypothetical protein
LATNDKIGTFNRDFFQLCNVALVESAMNARFAYFAHDLLDPAVHRRIRMLVLGGAAVTPIGFRRGDVAPRAVAGLAPIDLGRTTDGMLAKRVLSVARTLAKLGQIKAHVRGADVVLARNLEMLAIAVRARKLYAPNALLVYECLDVHRMLLSNGVHGGIIRWIESKLWRDVDLLLTSSPAFVRNYFEPRGFAAPIKLVENKVLLTGRRDDHRIVSRSPGPPWRIGWFGAIRCRKSLEILSSLVRTADGALEVIIRGRPSDATFPDFDTVIANRPRIRFAGPYRNPDDLAEIYSDVHFSWAIDYYESGQNSTWLLPNRIYEGSLFGAVPIGLAEVETGNWLTNRGIGVVLDGPPEQQLAAFFSRLDSRRYVQLASRVAALPRTDLVSDQSDCRELVKALCRCSPDPAQAYPGPPGVAWPKRHRRGSPAGQ